MSLKPIQEGRFKSTVKKTVKNQRLVGHLDEGFLGQGLSHRSSGLLIGCGEKSNFMGFFGANLQKKIGQFGKKFGGKFHQETMGKKQPISLQFLGQISLKSI